MLNNDIIITERISLLESLEIMDRVERRLLIVCEGKKFLGVISIGDIQRALLGKKDFSLPVKHFLRKDITFAHINDDREEIKTKMRNEKIESMPVIDSNGYLCDIIEWNDLYDNLFEKEKLNLPVVIMAGGQGTRLQPLTNIIPKPLIPVSDKTIIEEIMTKFEKSGCSQFYLSVNYKTETIKNFFYTRKKWNIDYIQEDKPLGTGGSLFLLKDSINSTFFVTNCDTLIDINLYDLIDYHKKNNNIVTIVSAIKKIHIPYGTIETQLYGVVKKLHEKPDYVYQVNTGLYVFEPKALQYVENDTFLNITDLLTKLILNKEKVGAFPVSEGTWVDIGNWDEYLKVINKFVVNKNN